jgi:hypothetical protein
MLITVTIGQLFVLITCGVVIVIFVYILQTVKNLRDSMTYGVELITGNKERISSIIRHVEQISADTEEVSRILCGRGSFPVDRPDYPRQSFFRELQNLQQSYREVVGSAKDFRRTVKKLGR